MVWDEGRLALGTRCVGSVTREQSEPESFEAYVKGFFEDEKARHVNEPELQTSSWVVGMFVVGMSLVGNLVSIYKFSKGKKKQAFDEKRQNAYFALRKLVANDVARRARDEYALHPGLESKANEALEKHINWKVDEKLATFLENDPKAAEKLGDPIFVADLMQELSHIA